MKQALTSLALVLALIGTANAQTVEQTTEQPVEQTAEQPSFDVAARQAFLIDATTGTVLFEKDSDKQMPTSSMSKMLTLYLVFDEIKAGKISLTDTLTVSEKAWKQEGSRMFLNAGQQVSVEDLIRGVAIQSGNDACVVLAEGLTSGSEDAFAAMMNAKAKELGMNDSHFMNASGLPDPQHYSTARDLATLAYALQRDFPEHYHFFSQTTFTFNDIKQDNRNPLLYRNINVDGIKTGHTEAAGFGLAASSVRDGRRMIAILNGMESMQTRADESAKLLEYGYREFGLYPIINQHDILAAPQVWLGATENVEIVASKKFAVTLPRSARADMRAVVSFTQPVPAPIKKGDKIGEMTITAPGMATEVIPLLAANDVDRAGFFDRVIGNLKLILNKG